MMSKQHVGLNNGVVQMQKLLIGLSGFLLTVVLPVPAGWAATTVLSANLSQANEVPPTGSPGTGAAIVTLDTTAQTLQVQETFSGLGSGTTASHIHCCLASPFLPGVNVGVATTVPTFPGFPLGVTSGTYNMTFDLTMASTYNPAFVTAEGGTVAGAEAALETALLAGETYINIHTTNFGGGEIRGFLAAVPEPSTWAMLLIGFAGLGFAFRQSRRKVSMA
jgi:CHRD domain/PEP-CTERM motif